MKKTIFLWAIIFALFLVWPSFSSAVTSDHLVISQVQITGGPGKTTNDFVEIYNPTSQPIDIKGYRLVKRVGSATVDSSIKSFTKSFNIPSQGYFLWANSNYLDISVTPNATSSASIAADTGVALRHGPENTGVVIDSLGWGLALNIFVEGEIPLIQEGADYKGAYGFERKLGGDQGNGQDTNDNSQDFFLQTSAHPRNSQSPAQPPIFESAPLPGESSTATSTPTTTPSLTPSSPASTSFDLEISEILPNPKGSDSGAEWVEFYNAGSGQMDLSGWILDDEAAEDVPGTSAYSIGEGKIIEPHSYLAIYIPKGKFALNNSAGDTLRLFDSLKHLRLARSYAGPAKEEWSFASDGRGSWQWTDNPTPGEKNLFPEPVTYSDSLIISEIFPNPSGDDQEGEFIEIHNLGNDGVDLIDWTVANERKKYSVNDEDFFDTEIAPGGYFVFYREASGIVLKNSGTEHLVLYNPLGEKVNEVSLETTNREGQSYAWTMEYTYQWTGIPTPGAENQFVAAAKKSQVDKLDKESSSQDFSQEEKPRQFPTVQLQELRNLPLGSEVMIEGVVAVEPGVLGEQVIYLAGSGIRVYLSSVPTLELVSGTKIKLSGEISSYHNELQIKVFDAAKIQILDTDQEIKPQEIKTGEVGESTEGNLVKISGLVTRNEGETFYVDDGSGEAKIYLKDSTGIEKPKLKKGEELTVLGFVSQYDETFRVLPRYQTDLIVGKIAGAVVRSESLPRTGLDFWLIYAIFGLVCFFLLPFFGFNKRKGLP